MMPVGKYQYQTQPICVNSIRVKMVPIYPYNTKSVSNEIILSQQYQCQTQPLFLNNMCVKHYQSFVVPVSNCWLRCFWHCHSLTVTQCKCLHAGQEGGCTNHSDQDLREFSTCCVHGKIVYFFQSVKLGKTTPQKVDFLWKSNYSVPQHIQNMEWKKMREGNQNESWVPLGWGSGWLMT